MINTYIKEYSRHGKTIIDKGILKDAYEPTKTVINNEDKIVLFSVENTRFKCYANVLSQRRDIYYALKTRSDVETYEKILEALNNPVKPVYEEFSNYFRDTNFDLRDIPFIKYYREDAGHYLTSSIIVSCYKDICNASFHRVLRLDARRAVARIVPRHLDYIVSRHHSENRDAPIAILLGLHPVYELTAAFSPPLGVYELTIGSRILGEKNYVKTPIHRLPIPASTSIVIEGVITREKEWEGPFVDILRLPDKKRLQPVLRIDAIYVNIMDEPLVHAIVPGYSEHFNLMGFPREPLIYESVKKVVSRVKAVRLTKGSGSWLHVIVSIEKTRKGEGKNAGLAVLNAHPSVKHVVVVDDDIDVDDPYMIEWAIATRVKAGEDIVILRGLRGSTLDPRSNDGVGDKVVIDATKPLDEPWTKYRMVKPE